MIFHDHWMILQTAADVSRSSASRRTCARDATTDSTDHRLIRITVESAAFPKYDRNLNTGGDNEPDTTFGSAHQRLLHDAERPSHVTLPVIPRDGR